MFKERVLTEVDVIDDGFHWRKYGKKKIAKSPYPRYVYIYIYIDRYMILRHPYYFSIVTLEFIVSFTSLFLKLLCMLS